MPRQLSLFGDDTPEASADPGRRGPGRRRGFAEPAWPVGTAPLDVDADAALARHLPDHVVFGTSSWTFPGWAGLVYRGTPTNQDLVRAGLGEYAAHPLFGAVGVDRSYYGPIDRPTLAAYREQLPAGFPCVCKVWSEITSRRHPRTGEPNPRYLDPATFDREVLTPMVEELDDRLGALVLEFPPLRPRDLPRPEQFVDELDRFLAAVAGRVHLAVELRNRQLLTGAYVDMLGRHRVGHVLNFWERMPQVGDQASIPGILETSDRVIVRLLIPPGQRYADRKAALAPFDRLVDPQPVMRDDIVDLVAACDRLGRQLIVLVNNKAEGSSPLTVRALVERIAGG